MVRGWESSRHPQTTTPPPPGAQPPEILAGAAVLHGPGATRFRSEGDRWLAATTGEDGKQGEHPVDLVVGRARMQMFVTTMEGGRLQVLPAMAELPGGAWFDYTDLLFGGPGADPARAPVVRPGEPSFWTGPDRNYDSRCARCHSSGYRPFPEGPGGPRFALRAHGVDCEACHGEDAGHTAKVRSLPGAPAADPMARIGNLPRDRQVESCLWCHMEGEVVRHGFRPGDDLFEFLDPTLLDRGDRADAEGRPRELIYEGLSFLSSACAGAGKLTCLSCHGPHAEKHPSQLRVPLAETDGLCAPCHGELVKDPAAPGRPAAAGGGGRGGAGHRGPGPRARGPGDVHDHSIGIPRPGGAGDEPSRDACTWCHGGGRGAPADAPRLPFERVKAASDAWWPVPRPQRKWTLAIRAAQEERPGAVGLLEEVLIDRALPRVARASAARLLGRYGEEARLHLLSAAADADSLVRRGALAGLAGLRGEDADRALRRGLEDASLAVRGAAARAALSGWERVRSNRPLLDALLPVLAEEAAAAPEDHLRWFRLGAARQIAGDVPGAIEAYERKLALDPAARFVRETVKKLR